MLHKMNLWHNSFEKIKNKTKTIEMRLNDEKRSLIKVGDCIEFTDTENGDTVLCVVTTLFKYADFEDLYRHHDKVQIGYSVDEDARSSDMLDCYSEENIKKYGAPAIELCVKDGNC